VREGLRALADPCQMTPTLNPPPRPSTLIRQILNLNPNPAPQPPQNQHVLWWAVHGGPRALIDNPCLITPTLHTADYDHFIKSQLA